MPLVSVVLPTKNEEEGVGICIEKIQAVLARAHLDGEIIVADNSTDRTPEIAASMGARVVKPDRPGYGAAYLYGVRQAKGKYVLNLDADDTYDVEAIPRFIEVLEKGEADFVLGNRFKGHIEKGAMPVLTRIIGSPVLTWVFNRIAGTRLSDSLSGMWALQRSSFDKLEVDTYGWDFNFNFLMQIKVQGLRMQEIPIRYYRRKGKSKLTLLGGGISELRILLRLLFKRPRKRK